jgi:uncharacterized protein YlxW (UPF0749 family)
VRTETETLTDEGLRDRIAKLKAELKSYDVQIAFLQQKRAHAQNELDALESLQ